MDTGLIAIYISIGALAISAISFLWSVRIFYVHPKPRVEIRLTPRHRGLVGPNTGSALIMDVVNHGPGRLVISDILRSVWFEVPKHGKGSKSLHLNLFSGQNNEPFGGATENDLPIKLEVGDQATFFYADYTLMEWPECFENVEIGVIDTWGRVHFPRRSELQDCLSNIHRVWKRRQDALQAKRRERADAVAIDDTPKSSPSR